MTDTGPRRGRPMRLPSDSTSMRNMHIDSAPRVSWLVATTRLYAPDPAIRRRTDFAHALGEQGVRADQTRISRWESGSSHMPDRVIAAYGRALGYQPGRLLTVAAGVRRSLDPEAPAGKLVFHDLPDDRATRDAMFERLLEHRHTGLDWTLLAAALESDKNIYLPPRMWRELCDQLLRELLRSTGFSWIRRFETARSLIRHPACRRAMMKSIGLLVTNRSAQAIDPIVSLLQEVDDPQVTELLTRMLGSTKGAIRRGAAWTIAAKLVRGHLGGDEIDAIAAVLPRILVRRSPPSLRTGAVDIFAALPEERARQQLAGLTGNGPITDLRNQLQWSEVIAPDKTRRIAGTAARRTEAALVCDQHVESDEMLARLIREALFHVHHERRHQAAVLLAGSPYADALADCLLDTLVGNEQIVLARGLTLLMYLGTGENGRGQLMTWANHHPDPWLRSGAIMAMAHLKEPLDAAAQHQLAGIVLTGSPALRPAALYTLGFTNSPELHRIAAAATTRERQLADWWIQLGPPIDDERPSPRD